MGQAAEQAPFFALSVPLQLNSPSLFVCQVLNCGKVKHSGRDGGRGSSRWGLGVEKGIFWGVNEQERQCLACEVSL